MREKKSETERYFNQPILDKRDKRKALFTPEFPTPTPNKDLLKKYLPKAATIHEQQIILPQTASPKAKKRIQCNPVKSLRRVESLPPTLQNPELKFILKDEKLLFDFEKCSGIPGISASQPFQQLALEMGGEICESFSKGVTVIVTDKKVYSKTMRKAMDAGVPSVGMLWLADCRQFKKKQPYESYLIPVGEIKVDAKVSKQSKCSDINRIKIPNNLKNLIKKNVKELIEKQSKSNLVVKQFHNESKGKYAILFQKDLSDVESATSFNLNKNYQKQNEKEGNSCKEVKRKSKSRGSKQSTKSTRSTK